MGDLMRDNDDLIEKLEGDLAECYQITGADPDDNEDWRLASYAVAEVRRLRGELDYAEAEVGYAWKVAEDHRLAMVESDRQRDKARAEVKRLRDGIRQHHQPTEVEVERFHDNEDDPGDLDGPCPDDPDGFCGGHLETIKVCFSCGIEEGADAVIYMPWPCPTAALLDDGKTE